MGVPLTDSQLHLCWAHKMTTAWFQVLTSHALPCAVCSPVSVLASAGGQGHGNVIPRFPNFPLAWALAAQLVPTFIEHCSPFLICGHCQVAQLPANKATPAFKSSYLCEKSSPRRKTFQYTTQDTLWAKVPIYQWEPYLKTLEGNLEGIYFG